MVQANKIKLDNIRQQSRTKMERESKFMEQI
jgi:hypothetical protein